MSMIWMLLWWGCASTPDYVLRGTVVELHPPVEVVLDHEAVPGLMPAMVMTFTVADPSLLEGLEPGHLIRADYEVEQTVSQITAVEITGKGPAPAPVHFGVSPVQPGEAFPTLRVRTHRGTELVLGEGQRGAVALSFIYTRCPVPEFCPAVVARLAALQERLPANAQIVAITLDPAFDTVEVLRDYAEQAGAGERWLFARTPAEALPEVALRAGMMVRAGAEAPEIAHSLRLLILNSSGHLVERYDDNAWPMDRVVEQLATGAPPAPPHTSGTLSTP